jgi:glycerophosphoryl diester phosphodiesterase
VLNIAHRGASGYAPENTRAAFEKAIAMGADMIETDVQLTYDNELVLIHDWRVNRTSDSQGPVSDLTLAALRTLDIGSWFAPDYAGERVVTVGEMLGDYLPRLPVVFEIKDPRAAKPLIEALVHADVLDRVHVTSFFWTALLDARSVNSNVTLGFLTTQFDDDTVKRCVRRGIQQICPHVDGLTQRRVDAAHAQGLVVRAFGISEQYQVDRLFETGADGATVNWPDWIPARSAQRVP